MTEFKYKLINKLNGFKIFAEDIDDIKAILTLWGDPKEFGNINQPCWFLKDDDYLKALEKEMILVKGVK